MDIYGVTRSKVTRNHALITPDTHVRSPLIGWKNAEAIVHITPAIGARFFQYTAILSADSTSNSATEAATQRFAYVLDGQVQIGEDAKSIQQKLEPGEYAFIPANSELKIFSDTGAQLEIFEKRYVPLAGTSTPKPVFGSRQSAPSEAFMGDPDAQLQVLLPKDPSFDMAVNLFTFQPGATLPLVEVHVMEHGLMLLDGCGVYRLDDCYYPIKAGDVIWMGSFCPQWWVAMGKTASTYLYYKDVHRELFNSMSMEPAE